MSQIVSSSRDEVSDGERMQRIPKKPLEAVEIQMNGAQFAKTRLRLCFVPDESGRRSTGTSISWVNAAFIWPILSTLELKRKRSRDLSGASPDVVRKRRKMHPFLPPVLLQGLGLRQGGELPLERCHLEVLGEQACEEHQDAAEEDEVGRRVKPKDARHQEHQLDNTVRTVFQLRITNLRVFFLPASASCA